MSLPLLLRTPSGDHPLPTPLTVTEQGMYLRFSARIPRPDHAGLCRLRLEQGTDTFLLGTLQPEGGDLLLTRTVSRSELSRRGITQPERGIVVVSQPSQSPSPDRWQTMSTFPLTPADPILRDALTQSSGNLCWKRSGDTLLLRFPWRTECPMPLLPLFCFVTVGEGWGLVRLDKMGDPLAECGETCKTRLP